LFIYGKVSTHAPSRKCQISARFTGHLGMNLLFGTILAVKIWKWLLAPANFRSHSCHFLVEIIYGYTVIFSFNKQFCINNNTNKVFYCKVNTTLQS